MSHVATIEIEIKDLDALRQAAIDCGLEFCEGQTSYKWYGYSVGDSPLPAGMTAADLGICDHALRIPGDAQAYEVGVVKRGAGYVLLWDFWQGGYGLQAKIGKDGGLLRQRYAVAVAKAQAQRQGLRVTERKLPNGKVQLLCQR